MKDLVTDPATHVWMGTTFRTLTGPADSGGIFSVIDSTAPVGFGPPRHVHTGEDEVLVILGGEIDWWLSGTSGHAGPGEALFIPRGAEHVWRAVGDEPCRHLIVFTPGGFDGFFAEMAEASYSIPEDMAAVTDSAARHNMVFTGPPLS